MRRALWWINLSILVAGIGLLVWPIFVSAESLLTQWSGERELQSATRAVGLQNRPEVETILPSIPETPTRPRDKRPGALLGRFEVPRLNLSYVLLEGTDNRTLDKSIGRVRGTGLVGESGNIAIAGHRNTHFRKLEWLRRVDEIILTAPPGKLRYVVEWARVFEPDDVEVLDSRHGPALTLVTCFPFEYVGSAPLRYVVRALPDETTRANLRTPGLACAGGVSEE